MKRRKVTFAENNNFTLGSLGCDRARLGIDIIGNQHNKYSDMNIDVDNDHLYNLSMSEHAKSIVRRSIKNKSNNHKT